MTRQNKRMEDNYDRIVGTGVVADYELEDYTVRQSYTYHSPFASTGTNSTPSDGNNTTNTNSTSTTSPGELTAGSRSDVITTDSSPYHQHVETDDFPTTAPVRNNDRKQPKEKKKKKLMSSTYDTSSNSDNDNHNSTRQGLSNTSLETISESLSTIEEILPGPMERTTTAQHLQQQQLNWDRFSFGLANRLPIYPKLARWRFTDVLLCGLLFILFIIAWHMNPRPFQRQFYINDLTISHPFAEVERVGGGALLFSSFGIPTFVIGVTSIALTPLQNKTYVLFVSLLGLYISVFTNCLVTELLKNWIGRHRPDFLARCLVRGDAPLNTLVYAKDVCTQTDMYKLMDGFKTTPSGHSSISFSGLGYLTLWLSGQLLISHSETGAWRSILSGLPILGSSYIAISRTEDYRHHFVDVMLGSIIGMLFAWWSYRRIFPSITDDYCFLPYQLIEETKLVQPPYTADQTSVDDPSSGNYQAASQSIDTESL